MRKRDNIKTCKNKAKVTLKYLKIFIKKRQIPRPKYEAYNIPEKLRPGDELVSK